MSADHYDMYIKAFEQCKRLSMEVKHLTAERDKLKEAYSEIFENYIPAEKMDEANNRLILLLEGDMEQMGRDMLKAHPLKGE